MRALCNNHREFVCANAFFSQISSVMKFHTCDLCASVCEFLSRTAFRFSFALQQVHFIRILKRCVLLAIYCCYKVNSICKIPFVSDGRVPSLLDNMLRCGQSGNTLIRLRGWKSTYHAGLFDWHCKREKRAIEVTFTVPM